MPTRLQEWAGRILGVPPIEVSAAMIVFCMLCMEIERERIPGDGGRALRPDRSG